VAIGGETGANLRRFGPLHVVDGSDLASRRQFEAFNRAGGLWGQRDDADVVALQQVEAGEAVMVDLGGTKVFTGMVVAR
jgi:hypothetical protein